MRKIIKPITILVLLVISIAGCIEKRDSSINDDLDELYVWADTIVYEVLIHNPDTLNNWESEKIKHVRQKQIVDQLFEMIYSGKKKPYHYYNNKRLSINEVKELEATDEFDRNKVGKLQFRETWCYDRNSQKLKKEVHSILLAYELYNESGDLRGYKAAFYLKDF